jgi:hypothetical protein
LFSSAKVAVSNYDQLVSKLATGDSIEFSNGDCFEIKKPLGHGRTCHIFEVEGGIALRIRSSKSVDPDFGNPIDEILNGWSALSSNGVFVVEVYKDKSLPGEYLTSEILLPAEGQNRLLTYREYLNERHSFPPEQKLKFDDMFLKFSVSTWAFQEIGDMESDQILLTNKGFLIADFSNKHKRAFNLSDGDLFHVGVSATTANMYASMDRNPVFSTRALIPYPKDLRATIQSAMMEKRRAEGFKPDFCTVIFEKIKAMWQRGLRKGN